MNPRPLTATFRCWPYRYDGAPTQFISVSLNGQRVGRVELANHDAEYSIELPRAMLRSGSNQLRFEYAYASAPKDVVADSE